MRKGFIVSIFFFFSTYTKAATITWDGSGLDGLWETAANWVGDVVPGPTDDVVLDNSSLGGTYTVTLPSGDVAVTVLSLTITPSGANNITLTLPNTNTSLNGFTATGTGDAVVLNNGAIFRNSSGATTTSTPVSVTSTNNFRINNGGRYIHNTVRSHTDYLVSRLSTAVGTENGIFEFDVPTTASYTISASGRTYGNLVISANAAGGFKTYTCSGINILTINGDLEINSNATLSYGPSTSSINIKQDCLISSGGNFNISNSTNDGIVYLKGNLTNQGTIFESGTATGSKIELNGTLNQNISFAGGGSMNNTITLAINNTAGANLLSPVSIPYNLSLVNGRIFTSWTNILTMNDDRVAIGGSTVSFVEGPMKKLGDDNFTFPVGVGSIYAPVGIENVSGQSVTDEFIAEYKRTNPQSVHGVGVQSGMDHISYVEYWSLNQNFGSATKKVSLTVTPTSFCKVLGSTYVSRWNGTLWTSEGSTNGGVTTLPPYETGTITSVNNISAFGDFTLITDLPFANNPLPIKLLNFNAYKINASTSEITWELAVCCSSAARFEVEKSVDSGSYTVLSVMSGSETNRFYSITDARLSKGITYYRLKMIDADGKVTYSKVVAIINDGKGVLISTVSPNPVHSQAVVTISTAKAGTINFSIYDIAGRVIKQWQVPAAEGSNRIIMNLDGLQAGVYHLVATGKEAKTAYRFVKQ